MKENDIIDVEVIQNEAHGNREAQRGGQFRQAYDKLPDLGSRLRFCFTAKNALEYGISATQEEKEELKKIVDGFIQTYVREGSEDQREGVFRELGKMKAENTMHSFDEYQNQIKKLNAKDPFYKKKGKWMFEQTYFGQENLKLNEFTQNLTNELSENGGEAEKATGWIQDAKSDMYEENRFSESKIKSLNQIEKLNGETYDYTDIQDWTDGDGYELSGRAILFSKDQMKHQLTEHYIENKPFVDPETVRMLSKKADKIYKGLKTMEEKLDFIIEYGVMTAAMDARYVHERELGSMVDMKEDFAKKYIHNADPATTKKVLEILARKDAEISIQMTDIYQKYWDKHKDEGKAGIQKADMFARCSIPGCYASVIKGITGICNDVFNRTGTTESNEKILQAENVDLNTITVKVFAQKLGMNEAGVQSYIQQLGADPDEKIVDARFRKDTQKIKGFEQLPENRKAALKKTTLSNIKTEFLMRCTDRWVHDKVEEILKEKAYPKEKRQDLDHVMGMIQTVPSESKIRDWLVESKELAGFKAEQYGLALNNRIKKIDKTVGYDQYLRLHTGSDAIQMEKEAKTDCLAKAMAALVLKNAGNQFKLSDIHAYAAALKGDSAFVKLTQDEAKMNLALTDPDLLQDTYRKMSLKTNVVTEGQLENYVRDMNQLLKNMMPSQGRSDEYKKFYRSVKNIAKVLTNYDRNNPADVKQAESKVAELNQVMMNAAELYMVGKERVRTTDGGKERFNNTLDALSVMAKYVPGAKESLQKVVDHINKKRDVTAKSDKFVKLENFGAKRAEQAKIKREAKNQKAPKTAAVKI